MTTEVQDITAITQQPLPLTVFVGDNFIAGNVKDAMKEIGASSGDIYNVPIDDLHLMEGFNIRQDNDETRAHIRFLADSMKANGVYGHKPIAVFINKIDGKNVLCVTDGHCRTLAARLAITEGAPLKTLPVKVAPKGTTVEDLTVELKTANDGLAVTPMGLGLIIKRLTSFQWDMKKIATKLAITVPYANDLLALVGAPAAVQELVASGKVSATLAITQIKKAPEKAAINLKAAVEKAEARGKTKATKKDTKPEPVKSGKVRHIFQDKDVEIKRLRAELSLFRKQAVAPAAPAASAAVTLSYDGMVDLAYTVMHPVFEIAPEDIVRDLASRIVAALFPAKVPVDDDL